MVREKLSGDIRDLSPDEGLPECVKDPNFVSPMVDYAFKEIMKNKKALAGFLGAVLGLDPKKIVEIQYLDSFTEKRFADDKEGILDVHIILDDRQEIDVEMQIRPFPHWTSRTLFYECNMLVNQIKSGDNYGVFKKCVSISVLNFKLFPDETLPEYYSSYHLLEDRRGILYNELMEFHVLELPKLPKAETDEGALWLWSKFLKAENREEMGELAKKDEHIAEAVHEVDAIYEERLKHDAYIRRQMAIWDENTRQKYARLEGLEEGRAEAKQEIAHRMKAKGISAEEIVEITGLTAEEIEAL